MKTGKYLESKYLYPNIFQLQDIRIPQLNYFTIFHLLVATGGQLQLTKPLKISCCQFFYQVSRDTFQEKVFKNCNSGKSHKSHMPILLQVNILLLKEALISISIFQGDDKSITNQMKISSRKEDHLNESIGYNPP